MSNLQDPRLLWLKGSLFVLLGMISLGLVVLLSGSWSVVAATLISIWAFCRAYYFAFYVVERYIDRRYRFAGLTSVLNYWLSAKLPRIDEKEASPGQSFVDADPFERSRWNAVRCWLVLFISPVAYWLVREVVFDSEILGVELIWLDLPMLGGLFLSPVTYLFARIHLRLGMRASWGWYLFMLLWSFVCPAIAAVTHFIFRDWPYWDDLRMLFMIYWIHLIAAFFTFRMLRNSGVFLRSL